MSETVKAEVLKKFKDAHTGAVHEVGDVIEVTPERASEILAVGEFVRELEPEPPAEAAGVEEAPAEEGAAKDGETAAEVEPATEAAGVEEAPAKPKASKPKSARKGSRK